jgi:transposase InsO family protein
VSHVYAAVEAITSNKEFTVRGACEILQVNASAYYAWRRAEPTARTLRNDELLPLVKAIFWKHRRRYGTRRIADDLADLGHSVSERKVAELLKIAGLKAIQPKSFKPRTTDSRHRLGYNPNLLLDLPPLVRLNQLWVGDITYIPLRRGGFCYAAILLDRFSRMIVGWNLLDNMSEQLVLSVLHNSICERQPLPGLIHHSDRGGQYASHEYRAVLRRADMLQSMSREANVYDNAFMESCFGTIKTELEMVDYQSIAQAIREFGEYIRYYNLERKHSSLNYLTPHQFEASQHARK